MSHKLFTDARLFPLLGRFDADVVAESHAAGCPDCAGPVDHAAYWRKPRGVAGMETPSPARRPSLCCRQDGCRRRKTPPQLRFLGRGVYLSVVVVLVAAMCQGPSPSRLSAIERTLGVSRRTVRRWLTWWRVVFPTSAVWRERRGRLVPPVADDSLPRALLLRLGDDDADAFLTVLRQVVS